MSLICGFRPALEPLKAFAGSYDGSIATARTPALDPQTMSFFLRLRLEQTSRLPPFAIAGDGSLADLSLMCMPPTT